MPSAPEPSASSLSSVMPTIGRWLCRLLLIAPGVVFIAQFAYAVSHHELYFYGTERILRYYVGPLLVATVYLLVLYRATAHTRALVATHAYAVIGALFLFEIHSYRAAPEPGPGGKVEKIIELRASGREAYPAFPVRNVNHLIGGHSRENAVVNNLPDVTTVLCRSADGWVWFDADHEGFNNPIDRQGTAGGAPLRVAVIGDSFIQGMCLPRAETIVGQLRERGVAARSFGVLGHGPLFELETLKRYVQRHKPQEVVWCFYEGNDLHDLEAESRISWLLEAIDSGPPELAPQQARRLERSIKTALDEHIANGGFGLSDAPKLTWRSVLGLRRSSLAMGLHYGRAPTSTELFARVMRNAKETVEGWGGRLHLCYLPEYARYAGIFSPRSAYDVVKTQILDGARDLNINIIDVSARFHDHPSPTDLFDQETVHYTREGAALAAETIAESLPGLIASARR